MFSICSIVAKNNINANSGKIVAISTVAALIAGFLAYYVMHVSGNLLSTGASTGYILTGVTLFFLIDVIRYMYIHHKKNITPKSHVKNLTIEEASASSGATASSLSVNSTETPAITSALFSSQPTPSQAALQGQSSPSQTTKSSSQIENTLHLRAIGDLSHAATFSSSSETSATINALFLSSDLSGDKIALVESLPEYFKKKQNEEEFKNTFRSRFPMLNREKTSSTDFQRFVRAREEVIEQAWKDYQRTYIALANLSYFEGEAEHSFENLTQIDENRLFVYAKHKQLAQIIPIGMLKLTSCNLKLHEIRAFQRSINYPCWHTSRHNPIEKTEYYGTGLTLQIANTNMWNALLYIKLGADINKYAPSYGNNPLTIATIKGWNHCNPEQESSHCLQKPIIEALLDKEELNSNAIDLRTGMTALHYACMRGDEPEFVQKLLARGVNPELRDYNGKTALDLLNTPYQEVKNLLMDLCDANWNKGRFGERGRPENVAITVTVPLEHERNENIKIIRRILVSK